jgi:hypothetical protein
VEVSSHFDIWRVSKGDVSFSMFRFHHDDGHPIHGGLLSSLQHGQEIEREATSCSRAG